MLWQVAVMKEWFDILNEDGTLSGIKKERELVHRDGDLHGTVHIWIVRPGRESGGGNEDREILLQKRSRNKDAYPGCYDISSAGHIPSGESAITAARRELFEELGIESVPEDFIRIGSLKYEFKRVFHGKPFHNREISQVYVYEKPVETEKLRLQEEEVEEVRWMTIKDCFAEVRAGNPGYCIIDDELSLLLEGLEKIHSDK